jgi:hypothetical protein
MVLTLLTMDVYSFITYDHGCLWFQHLQPLMSFLTLTILDVCSFNTENHKCL